MLMKSSINIWLMILIKSGKVFILFNRFAKLCVIQKKIFLTKVELIGFLTLILFWERIICWLFTHGCFNFRYNSCQTFSYEILNLKRQILLNIIISLKQLVKIILIGESKRFKFVFKLGDFGSEFDDIKFFFAKMWHIVSNLVRLILKKLC